MSEFKCQLLGGMTVPTFKPPNTDALGTGKIRTARCSQGMRVTCWIRTDLTFGLRALGVLFYVEASWLSKVAHA